MSPARRLLLLTVALAVGLALVGTLVLHLVGRSPTSASPAVAQDRPGTVVLVPGYGGSTSALEVLAARLRAAGRVAEVVQLPGAGEDDLQTYVPVLDAAVRAALAAGAPSVDVVGYSAGGIVTRLWAAGGGTAVTRRVVTLGSPHHGTGVAALGNRLLPAACGDACQQLVPGSALLDRLNSGDETPPGPAWLSLWTSDDTVVTPPDSARLAGAANVQLQDLCPGATTTHSDLPRDTRVEGVVLAALGTGPLAVPATCPT
ncbi:MAG TPA: alpha/beta fold hydrolase [Mycobacteriales bacterium]|jgi:triacylglycerol esterase/lipase EstA (alpha/beta hydrolase family)|nr:alpha/beta fold hydrolase [Mycobacteriales bacterium]